MKLQIDGQTAYAYTGGRPLDARLPGVVFIHGALHDHSVWILQSRALAHQGHAVLALDLPGHGRSAGQALSIEAAGRWVGACVQAAGLQQVTLVGHSMGSLIALEAAAALSEGGAGVRQVVMVGTAYPMKVSPRLLDMALQEPAKAIDLVNVLSNSTYAAKPSFPGPGFSIHGGNRALMRRMQGLHAQGNLFHQDFSACDAYEGLARVAPLVRCPVTLVLGDRDQMTSPKAVAPLVEAFKPEIFTLPCGHNLMAEAPEGLLDTLKALLRRP
jgi:pimeloyl-ACP methyl ester carboxylesterase